MKRHTEKKKGGIAVRGHLAPPDIGMIQTLMLYSTCCASVSELILLISHGRALFLFCTNTVNL